MQNLIDVLPILKIGTNRGDFPLYAQYLHSDGEVAQSCNGNAFVQVECTLPFIGDTNIHVLEKTLKSVKDLQVKLVKDNLVLTSDSFQTKLNIVNINFPQIEEPTIDGIEVDEGLLSRLKLASKFLGSAIYSYIYVGDGCVSATDKKRVFYSEYKTNDEPIGVNTLILSLLAEGQQLGVSPAAATVVKFDIGFAVFVVEPIDRYPIAKIAKFVKETMEDSEEICNVAPLLDALQKLSPIFIGESYSTVNIHNKKGGMKLKAESIVNGTAEMEIDSKIKEEFRIDIDPDQFRSVPLSFDVYYNKEYNNRLFLTDNKSSIVLLGG